MLLCSARSKIEVIRIRQTAFHFERLKLCLISAVVVLLVQIWRYYLPRSCFSCVVVGRFCLSIYEVIRHGYFIGFHLLIWNVDTYTIDIWFVVVVVIVLSWIWLECSIWDYKRRFTRLIAWYNPIYVIPRLKWDNALHGKQTAFI